MQQLHYIKFEKGKKRTVSLHTNPTALGLRSGGRLYFELIISHVFLIAANPSPLPLESWVAQTELVCPPLLNHPVQVVSHFGHMEISDPWRQFYKCLCVCVFHFCLIALLK